MPNLHSGHPETPIISAATSLSQPDTPSDATDQLLQLARRLSGKHVLAPRAATPSRQFYKEIEAQAEQLESIYQVFISEPEDELVYLQASEWLLDNYYVLQQAIQQIEENLPWHYYEEMPPLTHPEEYAGRPRIYALAQAYVQYEQYQVDIERMKQFMLTYQEDAALTIGELWALPLWLRFTLLEDLIQVADRLTAPTGTVEDTAVPPTSPAHVDATEVISHCILSLRLLAGQNWKAFFEEVSLVEQLLREDPTGVYGDMVFETRDQYRKAVEKLALYSRQPEPAVAQTALILAQSDTVHVGHFLIGNGRSRLEQKLGYRRPWFKRVKRRLRQHPTLLYLGSINITLLLILAAILWYGVTQQASGWMLFFIFLLSLFPAMAAAVTFVNWALTHFNQPRVLPKMDFSEGIPPTCRTLVVIPCLLTSSEEVDSLLQQIQHHYLRNTDPQLGFALLSDFADAGSETTPEDVALLEQIRDGVQQLNNRYPAHPFYLFHRRRLWNPAEGRWMGWERKRGKLHEFNRLLRGDDHTSFIVQEGDPEGITAVRYIITLDVDTILPLDAAARLVGTLAHPLNVAQFEHGSNRAVSGYTILQPRTEIQPATANQSIFTRIFAGDAGLDLYTLAVSDVYQDLFSEGSYTGKGIYEIDSFERSLAGRVPENSLLSHDLFEGIQGRTALVTDVVLYEDYPSQYLTYIRRSHRWIRGDWQLLPWLLPHVPTENGHQRNDLRLIHLWKITDNLRRSLQAPTFFLFFIAAWLIFPGSLLVWTLIGLLLSAASVITALFTAILNNLTKPAWRQMLSQLRSSAIRWLLQIAFLPYETILVVDAVAVTLWRILVSRRHLLRWTSSAHTARLIGSEVSTEATIRHSLPTIFLSLLTAILILLVHPEAGPVSTPLVLAWLLSFVLAYWISQPRDDTVEPLSDSQQQQLHKLARSTWLFFEQYVTPADNWLPPDHFQESPRGVIAHRTSPTNIGLYLLSALCARDFGYISVITLSLRLRDTFATLSQMERYRGHFLNWIDTTTLKHLPPRYISTVDSGNLAGCLLALKQGCQTIGQEPIWTWQRWQGLIDLLQLFADYLEVTAVTPNDIPAKIKQMIALINDSRQQPERWGRTLTQILETELPALEQRLLALLQDPQHSSTSTHYWRIYVERLRRGVIGMERELTHFLPWLLVWPPPFANSQRQDVQAAYQALQKLMIPTLPGETLATLAGLPPLCQQARPHLEKLETLLQGEETAVTWCRQLASQLAETRLTSQSLLAAYEELARDAHRFAHEMDFSFLYNQQREVFHIGYNLESNKLDDNYYDLLASEARIASLFAIAKRDVPASHWLHLSRPLTQSEGGLALLSWSGTMFEYLMPPLLMRSFPGTLLHESYQAIITDQIAYGKEQQIPWGISESGYYTFDNAQNYQYRAFGVPGLGFKRGLADDLVVAPYASLLALPIRPQAVVANLVKLQKIQMQGIFGLYEAADFTPIRRPLGQDVARVRSYMSHHQGMILIALLNYLQDSKMVQRFHDNPLVQSVELLLQEQIPARPLLEKPHLDENVADTRPEATVITAVPWDVPADSDMPWVHWLSNGRFHSLISNAGSGQLRGSDVAYTRWRPDTTQDDWGTWIYVQDVDANQLWSAGLQPLGSLSPRYTVQFFPHMARFHRHDHDIGLQTEIAIAPRDDVEVRRLTLANQTPQTRHLRLTSYGEVVLTDAAADQRHQAFAKLFVESEYVPEVNALFFRRRPRAATEQPVFLAHMLVVGEGVEPTRTYESDRAAFLGRGGTTRAPQALTSDQWLTGTTGATLDPIMALGQEVTLNAHAVTELAFITLTAKTRTELLEMCHDYRRWTVINRTFSAARIQAEQDLRGLNLPVTELAQIQQLLARLLYPHPSLRAEPNVLATNMHGQPALWAYGVSGDYPILLVKIEDEEGRPFLQTVLRAHTYWRRRGLKIDLVILNQQDTNYGQPLQAFIHRLIDRSDSDPWLNRRGGLFVVRQDQMSSGDRTLLQTAAHVVLDCKAGSLAAQLEGLDRRLAPLPRFLTSMPDGRPPVMTPPLPRPANLQFDNGYGGFSADGREYVVHLPPGQSTPAPWINVIANETFGFLVSESGGGYTWDINSGENRLTTWRNDPVTDMPAEALYIRDEETADFWSSTPQPRPADAPYTVHHGAGYSRFLHASHQLHQETTLFVPPDAPVKIVQLKLKNLSDQPRRLTLTYYAEWVLGTDRAAMQPFIQPWYRPDCHALLAKNPYNEDFGDRVAFLAGDRKLHGYTIDRTTFLGRLGTLQQPDVLSRIGLDDRIRSGLDPCGVIQIHVSLEPGADETVVFLLGQAADEATAVSLINTFQQPESVALAWHENEQTWNRILDAVQVDTPDPAMNLLLNRWLLYQALSCRIWGRSALYQSSGAYGFRDQLQDVMALLHTRPDLVRAHLLRAARHQFEAGDVLHWWHPPHARGVRTRITDDLVWLPYVTAEYVQVTGDTAVLDEPAPYLTAEPLGEDEEERYALYNSTETGYSLYDHCCRALDRASTQGRHGLPLMGAGDWNDGMNRVGIEGKGESVWLGWFLYEALDRFTGICQQRGDDQRARDYRRQADAYRRAIEAEAWDGDWYRRAYYDDGTPLGSAENEECRIDSLGQSWGVLTGAADSGRARQAMESVRRMLIKQEERLILLFTPPLDQTEKDPGYIKGYLPGIRENGGQYTHAALWTIWAFADMGEAETAVSLYRLINPIYRADTPAKAEHYKVEPYVISADVYGVSPHQGRGGWTWYTGSSGWMYRLGIEGILGFHRRGDCLEIKPRIPDDWPRYQLTYRYGQSTYHITVQRQGAGTAVQQVRLDGKPCSGSEIPLVDNGRTYEVEITIGEDK